MECAQGTVKRPAGGEETRVAGAAEPLPTPGRSNGSAVDRESTEAAEGQRTGQEHRCYL